MTLTAISIGLRAGAAIIGIPTAIYSFRKARSAYRHQKMLERLQLQGRNGTLLSQFTASELKQALRGYIEPKCSPTDPTNSDDEMYLSDVRESVFSFMDRAVVSSESRSFMLLLADSGMGKTTFCLNYRAHLQKTYPGQDVAVLSFSNGGTDHRIQRIEGKNDCILLLDAFDEDENALISGRSRLDEILSATSEFKSVIITCRSQFFNDDSAIPIETPIRTSTPRTLGRNQNLALKRFYLSPFDKTQVNSYINKHFPIWNLLKRPQRKRAFQLTTQIPELSARPMLLERLPEIARGGENLSELFELYQFMVAGWAQRESRWIDPAKLLRVSREIALRMFKGDGVTSAKLTRAQLSDIADTVIENDPEWNHLTTRSLLNRDSLGNFKFAHKSIMEYFVVEAAIEGEDRAISSRWTAFMKELLISWGYSRDGAASYPKAERLLTNPLTREFVMPLSDFWARPAAQSMPDFRASASRRTSASGAKRLASPLWRGSNVSVSTGGGRTFVTDHEFFLRWIIDGELNLAFIQRIVETNPEQYLPSYDQFISLVEGLEVAKKGKLIPNNVFFAISDSPGARRHLLVSLGRPRHLAGLAKIVDKDRTVSVTSRIINCYETGVFQAPDYASKISVGQAWIKR